MEICQGSELEKKTENEIKNDDILHCATINSTVHRFADLCKKTASDRIKFPKRKNESGIKG